MVELPSPNLGGPFFFPQPGCCASRLKHMCIHYSTQGIFFGAGLDGLLFVFEMLIIVP